MTGFIHRFGLALVLLFVSGEASSALDGEQQRIRGMLEGLCARCHAVTETGRSPLAEAPPFRSFGDSKLYDEDFGQRLQSGLTSIHPDMPTFHFDRRDAEAAVSYLRAIQERKK
jgi:cytochrome c